jgi:DNA processing protein
MNNEISLNTQAILLLTAPLIVGRSQRSEELLTPTEYNRLARILNDNRREPADLLGTEASDLFKNLQSAVDSDRLGRLLARGFLLGQALERWQTRSIWVISRADPNYPRRLKERLKDSAPSVLFGCGDDNILETGGLAVVGSRDVDETLINYTERIGRLAAKSEKTVVSGGARGVDKAAMFGSLLVGGRVTGVVTDSLERLALARDCREYLMDKRLVLISPYDPAAGFDVGHAMQRNKIIYALADAALVVNSDFEKGGTWAGAIEQLEKLHLVPVYVRSGEDTGKGLKALQNKGALPWPNPEIPDELIKLLEKKPTIINSKPLQKELPLIAAIESPSAINVEAIPQRVAEKPAESYSPEKQNKLF